MPYKLFCIFLVLLFAVCTKIYADTLRLEDFDEKVDVKILEMNEEFVSVIVPQREIGSISIKSNPEDRYPDTIFIKVGGKEKKVICKIVKITKTPGSITLQIPRERVSAMQIAFPDSGQNENDDLKNAFRSDRAEREHPPVDAERLKEQIKDELRHEFGSMREEDDTAIEERIRENLAVEFEKKQQMKEEMFDTENFGRIMGRMLYKGTPLSGCRVKITLLEKWGIFGSAKEGARFETVTDESGRYLFEKAPPGGYKLYWKPPNESSWIRSIKMEPDFIIEAGETYSVPDRETNIRTVN